MVNITLKEMIDRLEDCILNNKEQPTFYYKRMIDEEGAPEYVVITEVDLMRSRFCTIDGDFSEYIWELCKSNIYVEEE